MDLYLKILMEEYKKRILVKILEMVKNGNYFV